MADIALMKQGTLFANLTDEELKGFADISESSELDSGAIIIEEGSEGDGIYIIEEGQVIVSKSEGDVRSTIVILERGEQFGEMSLIEGAPTSARVSADGAVKLIKIPRGRFMELLENNDKLAAKIFKALAYSLSRRLRATSTDLVTWKPAFDL